MHDLALIIAGVIGSTTAIIHGVLTHRLMTVPLLAGASEPIAPSIGRLVPLLLQFSTFCWFFGGLALIGAAIWAEPSTRLTICIFVSAFYMFGALGNLWGTRGAHPGWVLLSISAVLIVYGARPFA